MWSWQVMGMVAGGDGGGSLCCDRRCVAGGGGLAWLWSSSLTENNCHGGSWW